MVENVVELMRRELAKNAKKKAINQDLLLAKADLRMRPPCLDER
jgi:hypothetical protein